MVYVLLVWNIIPFLTLPGFSAQLDESLPLLPSDRLGGSPSAIAQREVADCLVFD